MKELYKERLELLENGESFVLASIFDSQGTVPGTTGARMIIRKDGSSIGTVGGGKTEAIIIRHGREIFMTKTTVLNEYKLQQVNNKGIGISDGGDVSILMEYVAVEDVTNILLYEAAVKCLENGEKASIIRKFFNDGDNINYLYKNGEIIFNSSYFEKIDINKYVDTVWHRDPLLIKEENAIVFIEPICNMGRIYILGAGNVSEKLAELAKKSDFMVTVVDDRPEFVSKHRFPTTDQIIITDTLEECFEELTIDKDSYIVIVTRGHMFDLITLKQSLKTDAHYIGLIGIRRKQDIVYEALKEKGFIVDDFNKVHNPIGLEIGAETPEEIAVSIVAELIKVRRERLK